MALCIAFEYMWFFYVYEMFCDIVSEKQTDRIRENTDQSNSENGHFLRSVFLG